jgi:hypothetical protein
MSNRKSTWLVAALSAATLVACSPADDGPIGSCVPGDCLASCLASGLPGGTCIAGECRCTGGGDADADADVGRDDSGEVDPCAPPTCGPDELCGETGSGDGADNDCDTEVDETCVCTNGATLPCFPGDPAPCPPGLPCLGTCQRGIETCTEFAIYGGCVGHIGPVPEVCDGADNDCDGAYDEDLAGCETPVVCPASMAAAPMSNVPLNGVSIYGGTYDSWLWELFCPTTVPTCPLPADPTARDTSVLLISSGTYRARATIRVGAETYTCEFSLLIQGSGLRVEMTWDTQGSAHGDTDVDLHLHQMSPNTDEFFTAADCYYANCKASSCCYLGSPEVDWGLAPTDDLSACRDAPHGEGAEWEAYGSCLNPRLDVDVINCDSGDTDPNSYSFCAPENINVDNPPTGQPFRIMVNYYSEHSYSGITNATVNVYCGGVLRASFGPQELRNGSSYGADNDNWIVADVQFGSGMCGALDCQIAPINIVQTGPNFGPPWSSF